jgi:hypothetical protein
MATAAQPQAVTLPIENKYQASHGTLAERFWRSVIKSGPNDCWLWIGCVNDKGYGTMKVGGSRKFAHRVSFVLHGGTLDTGDCVLHRCDTPRCVNPVHLKKGDRIDNRADCVTRNRQAAGRRSGHAKPLPEEAIKDIRRTYVKRAEPLRVFARRYGVGTSTIHRILKGVHWQCA